MAYKCNSYLSSWIRCSLGCLWFVAMLHLLILPYFLSLWEIKNSHNIFLSLSTDNWDIWILSGICLFGKDVSLVPFTLMTAGFPGWDLALDTTIIRVVMTLGTMVPVWPLLKVHRYACDHLDCVLLVIKLVDMRCMKSTHFSVCFQCCKKCNFVF